MEKNYVQMQEIIRQVNQVILGKEKESEEVAAAFLANGHVLIEDIPGVGKTMLALAFSKAMSLDYRRIQFTPDIMPSDLTGFSIYHKKEEKFVYQPGVVFCNLLLADEINRTSPKTQSALLEVMEEGKVSVDGITRQVPRPFLVIATQNSAGSAGTQNLPEAQIDRFMISLSLGYPDFEYEVAIARSADKGDRLASIIPVIDCGVLSKMQKEVNDVYVKEEVYRYIVELIVLTRNHPYLEKGASPRATIALVKMSKASAWLKGRNFVTPNDVCSQFHYVVGHRIVLNAAARMEGIQKQQIIEEIKSKVKKPFAEEKAG